MQLADVILQWNRLELWDTLDSSLSDGYIINTGLKNAEFLKHKLSEMDIKPVIDEVTRPLTGQSPNLEIL